MVLTAAVILGDLLEMQTFRLPPVHTESETGQWNLKSLFLKCSCGYEAKGSSRIMNLQEHIVLDSWMFLTLCLSQ